MSEPAATWVYAVVPRVPPPPFAETVGMAGEEVRLVSYRDIGAVVGSIDAPDADEEALRQRLADPAWLEHAVRGHHRVVAACFAATATVPFRLATIYHDDQRVVDMLGQRHGDLVDALTLVSGRAEFGVQGFARAVPPSAGDPTVGDNDRDRPGTAYLHRRRTERLVVEQTRRSAADAAARLHAALADFAVASGRHPVPDQRAGSAPADDGRMVLNATYLVDDDRQDEFTAAVRQAGSELRLRVTGPWPAYSFVENGKDESTP